MLVGLDGPDPEAESAARQAWKAAGGRHLNVYTYPKVGYSAVRNRLLEHARGRIMLSMNDDVLPEPRCLETHLRAHEHARRTVVITGASPWVVHAPDRLFDRLIRETPMIFFYPAMDVAPPDPDRNWGFRHSWGLNISAPMEATRAVGGFGVYPAEYGYEDNEFAFKLAAKFDAPVLYRPEARAWHDHRMSPREYAEREYKLGYAAWGFAAMCPDCARAMFNRDVRSQEELAYAREYVERERGAACAAWRAFERTADLPASTLDGDAGTILREIAYQQHLPMKRWLWRRGLLDAADGHALEPTRAMTALSA